MILYLIIILSSMVLIIISNQFILVPVFTLPIWFNITGVAASTIIIILFDGFLAYLARLFQKKYNPFSKYFSVSIKEKIFYEKIGIKKFKDLLPDLGAIVKFKKGEIQEPKNKDYVFLYMKESCSGEIGHLISIFFGFLIIFCFPLKYTLYFGLPVSIVNAILNLLPVIALRYNRYKLSILYKRLSKNEQK